MRKEFYNIAIMSKRLQLRMLSENYIMNHFIYIFYLLLTVIQVKRFDEICLLLVYFWKIISVVAEVENWFGHLNLKSYCYHPFNWIIIDACIDSGRNWFFHFSSWILRLVSSLKNSFNIFFLSYLSFQLF